MYSDTLFPALPDTIEVSKTNMEAPQQTDKLHPPFRMQMRNSERNGFDELVNDNRKHVYEEDVA